MVAIYAKVIFGVAEPEGWKETRRTEEWEGDALVCPANKGHRPMGHRDVECVVCGKPTVPGKRMERSVLDPELAYAPHDAGDDLDEGAIFDAVIRADCVHKAAGVVYFGVTLAWLEARKGEDARPVPDPTTEETEWLRKYLAHLDYEGPPPQKYLLVHYE